MKKNKIQTVGSFPNSKQKNLRKRQSRYH